MATTTTAATNTAGLSPLCISSNLGEDACTRLEEMDLDVCIKQILTLQGINSLFPVQVAVLEHSQQQQQRDLCVSAPTGSGKTLGYLLPILQGLKNRQVQRLRALIIVPGRELAGQVLSVAEPFAMALGLTIGVAVGATSFASEQKRLYNEKGKSHVDILIATPGRLMEHIEENEKKNNGLLPLGHLEWLVFDEADRLLEGPIFDYWLQLLFSNLSNTFDGYSTFREPDQVPNLSPFWVTPIRKLLFSATLSRNPAKLAHLKLTNPLYIAVSDDSGQRYTTPSELTEYLHVCDESRKPVAIIHLLETIGLTRSICFTSSVEATDKLCHLLQLTSTKKRIDAFSGELNPLDRRKVLEKFNSGETDLLICSDAAARGLDLGQVEAVINYNVPKHMKTYIHRIGRTARAGRPGIAYTISAIKEAHHFKEMIQASGKSKLTSLKIPKTFLQSLIPIFEAAMKTLGS